MIFAGIDVNIITHWKAEAAGVEALGLWMWGMCYAQLHETDGLIPRLPALRALGGKRNIMLAKRLIDAGLWIENEDGSWSIWNYAKKNQTAAEIAAKRARAADRVKRWRERSGNADVTPPVTRYESVPQRVTNEPPPEPSPEPDNTTRHQGIISTTPAPPSSTTKSKRGCRLPEGWKPSEETQAWARAHGIPEPLGQLDEFADFWRAQPGARGVKLDWDATYRNRLRQVGTGKGARFAARGAEITKQPYDPEAPWMKLPEVG